MALPGGNAYKASREADGSRFSRLWQPLVIVTFQLRPAQFPFPDGSVKAFGFVAG